MLEHGMNDDRVLRVLEEIRDLQRQNVANYQEALRNQQESIQLQQAALRRVRTILGFAAAALILAATGLGMALAVKITALPIGALALLVLLVVAVLLLYSIWILVVSASFWVVRVDNLSYLFGSVFDAARWPIDVFRGVLRIVFVAPVSALKLRVSCDTRPPDSSTPACRSISCSMARATLRKELMFFSSQRVPNSFWPLGRTDTLASTRKEPSCILPSQMPSQTTRLCRARA